MNIAASVKDSKTAGNQNPASDQNSSLAGASISRNPFSKLSGLAAGLSLGASSLLGVNTQGTEPPKAGDIFTLGDGKQYRLEYQPNDLYNVMMSSNQWNGQLFEQPTIEMRRQTVYRNTSTSGFTALGMSFPEALIDSQTLSFTTSSGEEVVLRPKISQLSFNLFFNDPGVTTNEFKAFTAVVGRKDSLEEFQAVGASFGPQDPNAEISCSDTSRVNFSLNESYEAQQEEGITPGQRSRFVTANLVLPGDGLIISSSNVLAFIFEADHGLQPEDRRISHIGQMITDTYPPGFAVTLKGLSHIGGPVQYPPQMRVNALAPTLVLVEAAPPPPSVSITPVRGTLGAIGSFDISPVPHVGYSPSDYINWQLQSTIPNGATLSFTTQGVYDGENPIRVPNEQGDTAAIYVFKKPEE